MRSASVVDRYFAAGIPYDLQVFGASLTRNDMLDQPGVVRADQSTYVAMVRVGPDDTVLEGINGVALDWSSADPTIRVLEGALPDGTDPFEVVVNEAFVELHDLDVGEVVDVQMFGVDQGEQVSAGDYRPTGPRYTFRISAVVRMPIDIAVDEVHSVGESANTSANGMGVSIDFYAAHHHKFLDFGAAYDVQLAEGAATSSSRRSNERLEGVASHWCLPASPAASTPSAVTSSGTRSPAVTARPISRRATAS
jgi:hypothetical protein